MGRIERRGWLYWLVLIVLIIESFVLAGTAIPVWSAAFADPALWSRTPAITRALLALSWSSIPVTIAVVVLLVLRRRLAFRVFLVNVGMFLVTAALGAMQIDWTAGAPEVGGAIGAILGGGLEIALIAWALWAACRAPVGGVADEF